MESGLVKMVFWVCVCALFIQRITPYFDTIESAILHQSAHQFFMKTGGRSLSWPLAPYQNHPAHSEDTV